MSNYTNIVISDIHIGAGPVQDFDSIIKQHFISFLGHLQNYQAVNLIFNGDTFEFVQTPPYDLSLEFDPPLRARALDGTQLCFTEAQSLEKLECIINAHEDVFRALRQFLKNSHNKITFIPGNHDVDIFWPKIRERLALDLTGSNSGHSQLSFELDRYYRPPGEEDVLIEHGHQLDIINCFAPWKENTPPIAQDSNQIDRLLECTGTWFVLHTINRFKEKYSWIDKMPTREAIIALFKRSDVTNKEGVYLIVFAHKILEQIKMTLKIINELGQEASNLFQDSKSSLLSIEESKTKDNEKIGLEQYLSTLTSFEKADFTDILIQNGLKSKLPFDQILTDQESLSNINEILWNNPEILGRMIYRTRTSLSLLTQGPSFTSSKMSKILASEATKYVQRGTAKGVIMGHSHIPEHIKNDNYVNTGSWTLFTHPPYSNPIEFEHFYSLNYALINNGNIELKNYRKGNI